MCLKCFFFWIGLISGRNGKYSKHQIFVPFSLFYMNVSSGNFLRIKYIIIFFLHEWSSFLHVQIHTLVSEPYTFFCTGIKSTAIFIQYVHSRYCLSIFREKMELIEELSLTKGHIGYSNDQHDFKGRFQLRTCDICEKTF